MSEGALSTVDNVRATRVPEWYRRDCGGVDVWTAIYPAAGANEMPACPPYNVV
jgi:hypothetical protein